MPRPALAPRPRGDAGRCAGGVRGGRRHTDDLVAALPDLDADARAAGGTLVRAGRPLVGPAVFLHIIAETAQHAGHADILRESIDGQKTMG